MEEPMTTTTETSYAPASASSGGRLERPRQPYFDFSRLGHPELALCVVGPVLVATLFLVPWFSATGYATIHGRHGDVTGWQTYSVLRYFLLWCGVGAFILPWMVARGHDVGWRRGDMTAVHGLTGLALLLLNGIGFPPGQPSAEIHIEIGYVIALLVMGVLIYAGARSGDRHAPIPRRPPGA
jgi:hypothetical protein